jgi:hypothetical protein
MKRSLNLLAALLLASLSVFTLHAAVPTSEENAAAAEWAKSHIFAEQTKLPFSFTLGGKSSDELLRDWKRTDATRALDAERRERTRTWIDAATGLQVRLVATEYEGFPVVEWTVWLRNTGDHDTPLIRTSKVSTAPAQQIRKTRFHCMVSVVTPAWPKVFSLGHVS